MRYDIVDDVNCFQQSLQDVGALESLVKFEFGSPYHHLVAKIHEVGNYFLEGKRTRTAFNERHVVDGETRLERSVFEEGVKNHVGVGALLYAENDAHAFAGGFVIHVGNALDLLVFDHLRNALQHLLLVDHVRDFGDDYGLLAAVVHFNVGLGADDHPAAAGSIGVHYALAPHDDAARREIGALDMLHQPLYVYIGIVYIRADGVAALAQVVGGHVGSHTYGDTGRPVKQEQGQLGRKHRGFFDGVVEVERHVHSILVDVGNDVLGHLLEFGLCITHGSDRITVHASEVALAVHQRVALVPVLGEPRHCVINGTVAVRMELTEHLTYYTGRFLGLPAVRKTQSVHTENHPALYGFETVTHIGQGP